MERYVSKWGPHFQAVQNKNWKWLLAGVVFSSVAWLIGMLIDQHIPAKGEMRWLVGRQGAWLCIVLWVLFVFRWDVVHLPFMVWKRMTDVQLLGSTAAAICCALALFGLPPSYSDTVFVISQAAFGLYGAYCVAAYGSNEILERWDEYCKEVGRLNRERWAARQAATPPPPTELEIERDERLKEIEELELEPFVAQAQREAILEDYERRKS